MNEKNFARFISHDIYTEFNIKKYHFMLFEVEIKIVIRNWLYIIDYFHNH